MKVRREVLGDEHVDRAVANTHPDGTFRLTSPASPGATSGRDQAPTAAPARRHPVSTDDRGVLGGSDNAFPAATTNDLTREEIREVILQVGLYRGVSVSSRRTTLLRETLRDV
jgi:hypothetical protein